jgi:hypothetical protein
MQPSNLQLSNMQLIVICNYVLVITTNHHQFQSIIILVIMVQLVSNY